MRKLSTLFTYAIVIAIGLAGPSAAALSAKDIALAQKVIAQVAKLGDRYPDIELDAPEPLPDASGKFVSPYLADGEVTPWAEKSINAEAGALAGEVAGDKAADTIAKKIPFGGLMRNKTKDIATSAGAATALGGWDEIRAGSDQSFEKMKDLSVFLHVTHGDEPGYDETLAAAMYLYPELKKGYKKSLTSAYKDARKAQKKR